MKTSPFRAFARAATAVAMVLFVGACDQANPVDSSTAPFEPVIVDVDPLKNVGKSAKAGDAIPGQYIVTFSENVQNPRSEAAGLVAAQGGEMLYTYEYALRGFAARLPEAAVEALGRNPNVESITPDGIVHKTASGTQSNPPSWGLDRIDQANLPLNDAYAYDEDGAGVWAYVLDTGINFNHEEFGAPSGSPRAFLGFDGVGDGQIGWDCDGHGTHVSGTIGGETFGVAKQVQLIAVRVLNCQGSGSFSTVIAGVDYVTNQKQNVHPGDPAVANMSLGGGYYSPVNTAVENSIAAGVTYAVSAGNDYATDACTKSPASAQDAITVASTTSSDSRSGFSNIGTCVDIFAPGSSITSAWYNSATATNTISGTSMASPHVAGVAAIYLSANPGASPAAVTSVILDAATAGVVSNAGSGSPNLLLYSLVLGGSPPPPPPPSGVEIRVDAISGVAVTGKKRRKGNVTVTVKDVDGNPVANVAVDGTWTVNGSTTEPETGTTDGAGTVALSSSNYVGETLFEFCVTGLSGTGMTDVTAYPACSPYGDGGNPPPSGPPSALAASDASRGPNQRVNLSWSGGESAIVIHRTDSDGGSGTIGPMNNSGSHTDNLGKTSFVWAEYQVCNDGSGECSLVDRVTF